MANVKEQNLPKKTTIADSDMLRITTSTASMTMTVGVFKQQIGFNALQSENTALKARVQYLEEHSLIVE